MSGETARPPEALKNTDRELWREREGDYYADSIHVTEGGGIGINCGGHVLVAPVRTWFAALRAGGSAPQPQTWQPIETAPKDGSSILGYWPVKNYGQMYWSRDEEPGWTDGEYTYLPTHWMPLPAPPAAPAGEQP